MIYRFLFVFLALTAVLAPCGRRAGSAIARDPAQAQARLGERDRSRRHRTTAPVYAKSANAVTPIASLTKLMTAIVTIDAGQSLDEPIAIDIDDLDYLKGTHSRLRMGSELSRREMLRLALMASENRAASSLARHYPGGTAAFVAAMNAKAAALGMTHTHYADPTGLSPENVSTASDLAILVNAAAQYPLIREFSTTPSHYVELQQNGKCLGFNNTNRLVKNSEWDIQVSKTGLHPRGGQVPRDAGDDRQPAVRDRAARFERQVHAPRRRAACPPLARDRRDAARHRRA